MATIDISDDTVDTLIRDVLVNDYLGLIEQITECENKVVNGTELKSFEMEDLSSWLRTVAALDALFDWYLTESDARTVRERGRRA